ncbi:MAG: three-Cys-motif partner protein TcmP [Candidatus Sulfotelmatobacter sp.]
MTYQAEFGGAWTQKKLDALKKYLQAYTKIFKRDPRRARFFSISYVDAFAGTGTLRRPELGGLAEFLPELQEYEKGFRKGSVRRALEVDPPFDIYVFVEKDAKKCSELEGIAADFPDRNISVLNEDANVALLKWCEGFNTEHGRAVVFLDPFGASVEWRTISALGQTRAVDLWVLFPYSAINRMLINDRTPSRAWADRLTSVFGTADWESAFYSKNAFPSLLDSTQQVERIHKSANHRVITDFFVKRLLEEFVAVSDPLPMHNSNGSLLFILFFAAATTGIRIANDIIRKLASV